MNRYFLEIQTLALSADNSPAVAERGGLEAMQYCYAAVPDSQSIRLLSLDPGTDSMLTCSLSFATPSNAPSYEALSYVWGDPSKTSNIQCDGKTLSIPTSLAVALHRLRNPTAVRIIWADAICINQDDVPERNQQVTMMGTIYASASCVVAWLGEDEGYAKLAFDFFYQLQQLWPYDRNEDVPSLKPEHPVFQDPAPWIALKSFLENPYFQRGWIQQEIGLATHAIIYWGAFEIPLNVISRISHTFLPIHRSTITSQYLLNFDALVRIDTLFKTDGEYQRIANNRSISDETPCWEDFWDLLYIARTLKFSNRHDVIYAFLAHPSALCGKGKEPIVQVDYSRSAWQLYTDLAVKGLIDFKNPRVLSLASHTVSLDERLPSWVADLSPDFFVIPQIRSEVFRAGTGSDMVVSISPRNTEYPHLSVRGVLFDLVVECTEEFIHLRDFSRGVTYANRVSDALEFVRLHKKGSRNNDMSGELIASLLLVGGKTRSKLAEDDIQQHLANFYAYCEHPTQNTSIEVNIITVLLGAIDGYNHPVLSFGEEVGEARKEELVKQGDHIQFDSDLTISNNRRIFCTQKGYFGLGSRIMEPGDFVCVLFGFETPFILRKGHDHYILIGECYVQGIMRGEVMEKWRNGEVEEVDFEIH